MLFTATAEHDCHKCRQADKTIRVGDRAIKATARRSNCGESYMTTVYYHEECYQMKGGQHGKRTWRGISTALKE